jgi:DNA repair exonuclease SbcCD nuclease subunit
MLLSLKNGLKVNFIGDPHFGKKFGDVPLHRRGEREAMQIEEFRKELNTESDVCIMVGDLFDVFSVENEVLISVFTEIKKASIKNPDRQFIFMSGNHDESRDEELVSSFTLLEHLLAPFKNILCFRQIKEYKHPKGSRFLICPYSVYNTAEEEVNQYSDSTYDLIVGHWDVDPIAGKHNLAPIELMIDMTPIIVTGHTHTPKDQVVKDKDGQESRLIVTGSMIPYSHGEDPNNILYVTKTIEQIAAEMQLDPDCYKNKCLRVVLAPGEEAPVGIDCLQFSIKRVDTSEAKLEVTMEQFSFKALWEESFTENEVPKEVSDFYWEKYREVATDDNQS